LIGTILQRLPFYNDAVYTVLERGFIAVRKGENAVFATILCSAAEKRYLELQAREIPLHPTGFRFKLPFSCKGVRLLVHAMGFRYRLHVGSLPGSPDLVFPRLRKAIFVSGCFWHMHGCGRCRILTARRGYWLVKLERNAARDKRVQRALRRAGWGVLVVWECQTAAGSRERLRRRIGRFLNT